MKEFKLKSLILLLLVGGLTACGDSDLPENYEIVGSKILAVRVEEPEVMPGDSVSLSLLVGGNDMAQDSTLPVTWTIGNPGEDPYVQVTTPYNEPYLLTLPGDILGGKNSVDVPIFAGITINNHPYTAMKRFRITTNPVGMNPRISHITATWNSGQDHHTADLALGETVSVDKATPTIAFTVSTLGLPQQANGILVYSWYFTSSSNSPGILKVDDIPSHIEALLGAGVQAADFRPTVMFSLYGEDAKGTYQPGRYTIYIVVRDNASVSHDSSKDRLGTDFYYMTLDVL